MNYTTIDTILQRRPNSEATPFWKLHIEEDELSGLIEYVKAQLNVIPFDFLSKQDRKRHYLSFDREVCILYALWWCRKYDGGKQSWEEPLLDFGIDLKYMDYIKEAILLELKNNRRLNITIFRSEANFHMYLQSLLAQGGLPMRLMSSEYCSSFENYLYYLISEYEEMDIRDWTNISVARDLADKYLNNRTLKESEAVLDFSMEIVKAYINNDETTFDDYDEIKNIIAHIREKRGNRNRIERKYFKISWEIKTGLDSFELLYSISVPYEIILDEAFQTDSDGNDVVIVSYYIANRLVGSYHRHGERYFLMPGTSLNQKTKWNRNQGSLVLTRKIKNTLSEDHSLINSQPPYLEEPILLQYKNGTWVPKQIHNNDTYACLMPQDWDCSEVKSKATLTFDGTNYSWLDINWKELDCEILHFRNVNTGEELDLDKSISDYSLSFVSNCPDWIEASSEDVVVNNDNIKFCFKCFKEDQPCSRNGFKFLYKYDNSPNYTKYIGGALPSGPILFKVEYPEGGQSKTFSMYIVNGLQVYPEGKDKLRVIFTDGHYALLANQNINKLENGLYQIEDKQNLRGLAPMMFRLYPDETQKYIELGFSSPIQKSCFIDNQGRILSKDFPVALSELHNYKINLSEQTKVILSYYERTDNSTKCITRKNFYFVKGRYPLDILKDEIDRFVLINGANDYKKYITIKLAGSDSELKLRRNAFRAQQCENENSEKGIYVTRNGEPVSNLLLHAIAINVPVESALFHSEDIVLKEANDDPGHYYLPELEDSDIKEFMVFSDNTLETGNRLSFFLNRGGNSIDRIASLLADGDEQEWKNTWFYVNLVFKYRLSYFNSFNTFFAIVNDPYLIAEFLVRINDSGLLNSYDRATVVNELARMERELSFRFHYLPSKCWKKQQERLEKNYNELVEKAPVLKTVFSDSIAYSDNQLSLLKDLLVNQFGESDIIVPIFYSLLGNSWPVKPDFKNQAREYLMTAGDALSDFEKFIAPDDLSFVTVEYHPLRKWKHYRPHEVLQRLQYLAIVLPQCAAQYVHGANMDLWNYQVDSSANEFIRRMINYISIYAPETYNELFLTALLREPVIQKEK